jgi:hypothetical protein
MTTDYTPPPKCTDACEAFDIAELKAYKDNTIRRICRKCRNEVHRPFDECQKRGHGQTKQGVSSKGKPWKLCIECECWANEQGEFTEFKPPRKRTFADSATLAAIALAGEENSKKLDALIIAVEQMRSRAAH